MRNRLQKIQEMLAHQATGSRSSVLGPLLVLLTIIGASVGASLKYGAPTWLLVTLVGLFALVTLVIVAAFIVFARHDPDALRSEKFALSRWALKQGLLGDDKSGLHDPDQMSDTSIPLLLDPKDSKAPDEN